MSLKVSYDSQIDANLIRNMNIAIIGYGSQAHAHAQNLRDSGVKNVKIGLQNTSKSRKKALDAGFEVDTPANLADWADLTMILIPDELQAELYKTELKDNLKKDSVLAFAHGFNVHFKYIEPRSDLDVIMVAPKGPGHTVRGEYVKGGGVPCLVAVAQDKSGKALNIALSYASNIGGGKSGVIETNFKDECETDLFGEQAVLCGGLTALVQAGFETLVEAGYPAEMAYFECVHELKLIIDLIYEGGIANMRYSISNTAEYGDFVSGPRVITPDVKARMKDVLTDIQSGKFARNWMLECGSGENKEKYVNLNKWREDFKAKQIEAVGSNLRDMMPWIAKNKLVDQNKN